MCHKVVFITPLLQLEPALLTCLNPSAGQLTGVRDPQRSMSRLKQNVKLLKEDLEDFKSKLDILEERIKATLDLVSNIPNAL